MRAAIAVATLTFLTGWWTGAAQAQRYVASGQTVKLQFFASVNPDCSAAGMPTFRITQPPQHGRVSVTAARDFVHFERSNVRSACNRRRVAGIAVRYTAQRGCTGSDAVSGEVFYPQGTYRSGTFTIQVR